MPASDDPTLSMPESGGSQAEQPSRAPADGLSSGVIIGGRFRIISRLGRGGMGEVYRADDLALGAPVALKFLPARYASDPSRLARLRAEVRLARQVSHPNVCRLFDIGSASGSHFITMELVDGEDLSLLLRRIGRLPVEKAVELTRQLCLGLAAAHELGIIHRDLKPSNILIDGKGRARIADFGIAQPMQDAATDTGAGTPAYMAPEQLLGQPATVRSDLYSLGLVLYEIFTGRPAREGATFAELQQRARTGTRPESLSTWIPEIEPGIEEAILRCLEPDPEDRPSSAIALLADIPGGDPLRAMAEAGMTPSPDVVARSGPRRPISTAAAVMLLLGAVLVLPVTTLVHSLHGIHNAARLEKPPAVLIDRARELARLLVPPGDHEDAAWGGRFLGRDHVRAVGMAEGADELPRGERDRMIRRSLGGEHPASFEMWFRFSHEPIVFSRAVGSRFAALPAMRRGDLTLGLSQSGRLLWLEARPGERGDAAPGVDPASLFEAAGLDIKAFAPTDPRAAPPNVGFDSRSAWEGQYPGRPEVPLRVETASLEGSVVWFRLVRPWEDAAPRAAADETHRQATTELARFAYAAIFVSIAMAAVIAAYRQLRLRRGDLAGALRLAAAMFVLQMFRWVVGTHHVSAPYAELALFMEGLGEALAVAFIAFALYVAFEPFIRKHESVALVSWTRLLAGRWNDALIARDILIGLSFVTMFKVSELLWKMDFSAPLSPGSGLRGQPSVSAMLSIPGAADSVAYCIVEGITDALLTLLGTVFLCRITGRRWIGGAVAVALLAVTSAQVFGGVSDWRTLAALMGFSILSIVLTLRVGLLALVTAFAGAFLMNGTPATASLSAWFAPSFHAQALLVLCIAAAAFRNILVHRAPAALRRGGARRAESAAEAGASGRES